MALIVVGFGSSASLETVAQYQDEHGFPGAFVVGPSEMASQFGIQSQATKVGISADGVITFNEKSSSGGEAAWRERLSGLSAS